MTRTCAGCGEPFDAKVRKINGKPYWQKYCSRACYRPEKEREPWKTERVCPVCTAAFMPEHPRQVSCSEPCSKTRRNAQVKAWREENADRVREHHRDWRRRLRQRRG